MLRNDVPAGVAPGALPIAWWQLAAQFGLQDRLHLRRGTSPGSAGRPVRTPLRGVERVVVVLAAEVHPLGHQALLGLVQHRRVVGRGGRAGSGARCAPRRPPSGSRRTGSRRGGSCAPGRRRLAAVGLDQRRAAHDHRHAFARCASPAARWPSSTGSPSTVPRRTTRPVPAGRAAQVQLGGVGVAVGAGVGAARSRVHSGWMCSG